MLRIHFGSLPSEIYNTKIYYANHYDKNWVMEEFAQRVIRDIDASEVIAPDLIQNDIFDSFPSTELSVGTKTLLLIRNRPRMIFNASNCGDNCAKHLLELTQDRDIKITLHHAMNFGKDFAVKVINDNKRKVITDPLELLMLAHHYLIGGTNEG